MEKQIRKEWQQPMLEVLDVAMTMGGPNGVVPDAHGIGGNNRHDPS